MSVLKTPSLKILLSASVTIAGMVSSCDEQGNLNELEAKFSESLPTGPSLVFSAKSIDFGEISATAALAPAQPVVGRNLNLSSIEIFNQGEFPAYLDSVAIDSTTFNVVTQGCADVINAGASCLIEVGFAPVASGSFSSSLQFKYLYDPKQPVAETISQSLPITGSALFAEKVKDSGITPTISSTDSLSFDVTVHNFGQIIAGHTTTNQSFTLTNLAATRPATITSVALADGKFALTSSTCLVGTILEVQGNCTFSITFAAKSFGSFAETLTVGYTYPDDSTTLTALLPLSGLARPVQEIGNTALSFTPATHDFGSLAIQGETEIQKILVKNSAIIPIYLKEIVSTSTNFKITNIDCPLESPGLGPGKSCHLGTQFTPHFGGEQATMVSVRYGVIPGVYSYTGFQTLVGFGVSPLNYSGATELTNITTTTVDVHWQAEPKAIAFVIYKVINGELVEPFTVLNTGGSVTSATLKGLSPETTYTLRARAVDELGSPDDNQKDANVTTDPLGTFNSGAFATNEGVLATLDLSPLCFDAEANTPAFAISTESDAQSQCSLSGTNLACTPLYKSGHADWTSDIKITCSLNGSSFATVMTLSVADVNRAPVVDAIADLTVSAADSINVNGNVSGTDLDADGDALAYTCTFSGGGFGVGTNCTSLPGTSSFDATTGILVFTPSFGAAVSSNNTDYTIVLTASDQQAAPLVDAKSFVVTVTPASTPSLTISTISPATNATLALSWGTSAVSFASYCLLEDDTVVGHCSWINATSLPASYTASGEGSHTLSAWIRDSANEAANRVDSGSIVVDLNAPTWTGPATHSAWSSSTTSTPTIGYTADASDGAGAGIQKYRYAVGTGTNGATQNDIKDWADTPSTSFAATISGVSHGNTYYINMKAIDQVNRESTVRSSAGFTLDTVYPTTTMSYPTENEQISLNQFDISGSCEDGLSMTISYSTDISGSTSPSCSSGSYSVTVTVSGTPGNRVITASQVDLAGNDTTVVRTFERIPEKVEKVSVGNDYSCLVTTNGKVECWGYNASGQLGDATTTSRNSPIEAISQGVSEVYVSNTHSCALTTSQGVKCWGAGASGQIGDGGDTNRESPVDVSGLTSGVSKLYVGYQHNCAITTSGGVKCWGNGQYGRVGYGSDNDAIAPEDVTGLSSGVTELAMSYYSTCALVSGGVKCWGKGADGELGDGPKSNSNVPVQVSGLTSGVSSIYSNRIRDVRIFCAIMTADGSVKCWGKGTSGRLGNGGVIDSPTPSDVSGITGASSLGIGADFGCAIISAGALKCWGKNAQGQLGNNSTTESNVPVDVVGLTGVTKVRSMDNETCALKSDNSLYCWGYNLYGQLGDRTNTNRSVPTLVDGLSTVARDFDMGLDHICATTTTKGLRCWGDNDTGQLGDSSNLGMQHFLASQVSDSGLTSGTASADLAPSENSCFVTTAGGVKCVGVNTYGQLGNNTNTSSDTPVDVIGLSTTISQIFMGDISVCAKDTLNGLYCWGYGGVGNLGNGSTSSSYTAITIPGFTSGVTQVAMSATARRTCLIDQLDDLYCFGQNNFGQIGDGSTTNQKDPTLILNNVASMALDTYSSYAVTTSGAALAWGYNIKGQLGDGSFDDHASPAAISGLASGVSAIYTGRLLDMRRACAVMSADGSVKCWGTNNANGLLGDGVTTTDQSTPVTVSGLTGVSKLVFGSNHTCALTTSGGVKCWGAGTHGVLGNGAAAKEMTPVDAIGLTSGVTQLVSRGLLNCALKTGGEVKCWGYNAYAQLGNGNQSAQSTPVTPTGMESGVSAIHIADRHICAIYSSGAVKCAGENHKGQLGQDPAMRPLRTVGSYN